MPPKRKEDRAGQDVPTTREEAGTDAREAFLAEPPMSEPADVSAPATDTTPPPTAPPAARRRKRSASQTDVLAAVKRAARARQRCEERTLVALQEAVRAAKPHHSLREIAEVAGVSYDTIDRWTKPE